MDRASLKALIQGGETPNVEFKIAPPRPADLAERLCGFANGLGGFLILGVADQTWEIMGVKSPSAAQDTLLQAARLCKPPVKFDAEYPQTIEFDEKYIVIAAIPPNDGTLYQASGVCWIRRGTYTVPLTVAEIEEFLYSHGVMPWETQVVPRATLADLDMSLVDTYLEQRSERGKQDGWLSNTENILLNIGCAIQTQGILRPTNAGLLLFGFEPQQFLLQAEITCVLYRPTTGKQQRYADRRILHGPITRQIDQAEAFLKQYIPVAAYMDGFHRIDEPDYPPGALREAVVNAVVHRDYSLKGEGVRLFYYPDHIEIHNPGVLMPGLSLADLRQGMVRSRPRNPVVATVLRDFPGGYMERVGSGIRFMMDQMRELGRPDPEFRAQDEFLVNFFRENPLATQEPVKRAQPVVSPLQPPRKRPQRPDQQPQSVPTDPFQEFLARRQQQALLYLRQHGHITGRRYSAITGVSPTTALQDLESLRQRGILKLEHRGENVYYTL